MGTVDNESLVGEVGKPDEHIFLKEKAAWWIVPDDGIVRHEAFDETFQRRLEGWVAEGSPRRDDVGGS
jgi:hypothetical protein